MSGHPRLSGSDVPCSGDWACSHASDGRHCVCVMDTPNGGRAGRCCQCGPAARTELAALGVTDEQMATVTGFGLRRLDGCKPDDTILNKYAAGALTSVGVLRILSGVDL